MRVVRADYELVCNFSDQTARIPVSGSEIVVSSHETRLEDRAAVLEPLAGALLR
jgi:hypothetical protein